MKKKDITFTIGLAILMGVIWGIGELVMGLWVAVPKILYHTDNILLLREQSYNLRENCNLQHIALHNHHFYILDILPIQTF